MISHVNIPGHSESLKTIDRELGYNKKKEIFISEHYTKYHTDKRRPPAWKTLEILSLGTLSKLYSNLKNSCNSKDIIAKDYGTANHTYLHSWLQTFTQIRNICAHHGRLWNKNLPGRPKLLSSPPSSWVKNVPPVLEHHMLYVHLCCMKYLFNVIHPGNNFTYRLYVLLKKYPNIDINALGMKKGWSKEPLWNNKLQFGTIIRPTIYKATYLRSRIKKQVIG
ncbi:MAG TPA: Abi family protein [Flavisolibacter sp.]|nr:Abi family protein [Flavisolibacter sp.]